MPCNSTYCISNTGLVGADDNYITGGTYNGTSYWSGQTNGWSIYFYTGTTSYWCLSDTLGGSCYLTGKSPCTSECPDLSNVYVFSNICLTPTPSPTQNCNVLDFTALFDCEYVPTPTPTPSTTVTPTQTPTPTSTSYCSIIGVDASGYTYTPTPTPTPTVTPTNKSLPFYSPLIPRNCPINGFFEYTPISGEIICPGTAAPVPPTLTPTPTQTVTPTLTSSPNPSETPTNTPTPTITPTYTPTPTPTPTPTQTGTGGITLDPFDYIIVTYEYIPPTGVDYDLDTFTTFKYPSSTISGTTSFNLTGFIPNPSVAGYSGVVGCGTPSDILPNGATVNTSFLAFGGDDANQEVAGSFGESVVINFKNLESSGILSSSENIIIAELYAGWHTLTPSYPMSIKYETYSGGTITKYIVPPPPGPPTGTTTNRYISDGVSTNPAAISNPITVIQSCCDDGVTGIDTAGNCPAEPIDRFPKRKVGSITYNRTTKAANITFITYT